VIVFSPEDLSQTKVEIAEETFWRTNFVYIKVKERSELKFAQVTSREIVQAKRGAIIQTQPHSFVIAFGDDLFTEFCVAGDSVVPLSDL
jgi:hypothetical protein